LKVPSFFLILCFGIILCISSGCNDAPNPVGAAITPAEDYGVFHVDTFYAQVIQPTQPNLLFTRSIDRVMLGRYQANQGQTYEAWTCLKFYTWPDSLLGVKITGATLQLTSFYRFGDTTADLSFSAYRAIASTQGDSLTFDSLNLMSSSYFSSTPISNPARVLPTDSLCSLVLDTAVVREWLISNIDTTHRNDGIILRPANSNVIKGFYSCNASDTSLLPTLTIYYVDTNGIEGIYVHKTGSSKYVASVSSNLFLGSSDGKMRVQDGISYRGLLALDPAFDKLSRLWPITIHQAVLQLSLDRASSSCSYTPTPFSQDLLYGLSVGTDNNPNGFYSTLSTKLSDSVYQFNVLTFTPGWIKNISERKIMFSGYFESGSFDLFTFYGSGSAALQRPKIIISYSTKY
jgi:hypothetical protein